MKVEIHHVDMRVLAERGMIPLTMSDEDVGRLISEGYYRKVATVNVVDLSEAFRKTQNGVGGVVSWAFDHPAEVVEVELVSVGGRNFKQAVRSSAAGDVFCSNGTAHFVGTDGFRDLGPIARLVVQQST
jgi:hypothetical protein